VLHAGARQVFQLSVAEVVVVGGADVFVGEVDAADALIVGRERDGNVCIEVEREGMVDSLHSENAFIGAEVDFDHHVLLRHLFQERLGIVFKHDVDAVTNALGVTELDGLANVEAETFRRYEAEGQFTRVQRDVDLGVDRVQILDHLHVQGVIAHGDKAVFGLDEVDAYPGRLMRVDAGLDGLKAEQRLREDPLWRMFAEDLVDVADLNPAGRRGLRGFAVFDL